MAGIKLIREEVSLKKGNECNRNWPIKVTAESDIDGLDSNIFVYHAADENDPIEGDTFSNVASLQDMESLPIGAPAEVEGDITEDYVPYYRTNEVELNCHNLNDAARIWSVIKRDAALLVREYKKSINLTEAEEYIINL